MKSKLFILLFFFTAFLKAQDPVQQSFAGWANVAAVNGNNITIVSFGGNPKKYDDTYVVSDIAVGDVLWAGNCSRFIITAKSGNVLTVTDPDPGNSIMPIPGERIALVREVDLNGYKVATITQHGDGNAGSISGIGINTAACLYTHYLENLKKAIINAKEVYRYAGTSGTAPSITPSGTDPIIGINAAGEIYTWNGSVWSQLTTGGPTLSTANTHTISSSAPSYSPKQIGDIWQDISSASNKPTVQTKVWTGSSWYNVTGNSQSLFSYNSGTGELSITINGQVSSNTITIPKSNLSTTVSNVQIDVANTDGTGFTLEQANFSTNKAGLMTAQEDGQLVQANSIIGVPYSGTPSSNFPANTFSSNILKFPTQSPKIVDALNRLGLKIDTLSKTNFDTVPSYTALRANTYNSNLVFVQDFNYVFNGQTYKTKGGTFRKVASGTENGSTIIVAANGTIWERDWNKVDVIPEWFQVGGYDINGFAYTSRYESADGIYNDCDRLRNAAQLGQNIILGSIVQQYDIDRTIIPRKDQTWQGNGVILKRANSPVSTLVAGSTNSALKVTDASSYRVGQEIMVLNTATPYGGYGFGENSRTTVNTLPSYISAITGNDIVLTYPLPFLPSVGNPVLVSSEIIADQVANFGNISIKNLYFDGNRLNGGQSYRFPSDWRYYYTLELGNKSTFVNIENCHFYDTPSENITFGKGLIFKSYAKDLGGSFVHISSSDTLKVGLHLLECETYNTNIYGNDMMAHSEGVVTYSALPMDLSIINCKFVKGREYVFGILGAETFHSLNMNTRVLGNVFEDFRGIHVGTLGVWNSSVKPRNYFIVKDNKFTNCGDLMLFGANAYKGITLDLIDISNNIFIDSRVFLSAITNINIHNNRFLFREGQHKGFIESQRRNAFYPNVWYSAIATVNGNKIKITDNYIEGLQTYNDTLAVGISTITTSDNILKTSTGVNTDYFYTQDVAVNNNQITGFKVGIANTASYTSVPWSNDNTKNVVGWEIKNNKITLHKDGSSSTYSWGISVPNGCVASNNTIIKTSTTNLSQPHLIVCGIAHNTGTPFAHTKLLGGIALNNICIGRTNVTPFESSILLGNGSGTAGDCNAIIEGNIYPDNIYGIGNNRSYIGTNVKLNTINLPLLTNPSQMQLNFFNQNKNQY